MPNYFDYYWGPGDQGYLGESYPGEFTPSQQAPGTAGRLEFARIKVPAAGLCTAIAFGVQTAGSSLTAGQCFAALFYANGALLAQSVDQSTNWAGTGQKDATLNGGPYFLHAGEYYGAFWFNGTTGPTLLRASSVVGSPVNNGRSTPNLIFGSANTGLTTAAPTTMGAQTAGGAAWWMALK